MRDVLLLEPQAEGLFLRGKKSSRLTWEETYKAMAAEREDWSDLDTATADGLPAGDKW